MHSDILSLAGRTRIFGPHSEGFPRPLTEEEKSKPKSGKRTRARFREGKERKVRGGEEKSREK